MHIDYRQRQWPIISAYWSISLPLTPPPTHTHTTRFTSRRHTPHRPQALKSTLVNSKCWFCDDMSIFIDICWHCNKSSQERMFYPPLCPIPIYLYSYMFLHYTAWRKNSLSWWFIDYCHANMICQYKYISTDHQSKQLNADDTVSGTVLHLQALKII